MDSWKTLTRLLSSRRVFPTSSQPVEQVESSMRMSVAGVGMIVGDLLGEMVMAGGLEDFAALSPLDFLPFSFFRTR